MKIIDLSDFRYFDRVLSGQLANQVYTELYDSSSVAFELLHNILFLMLEEPLVQQLQNETD